MTGFLVFLRKELLEIRRTWRIWVIPGILLFIAVTSPILAQVTPELVRSLASDQPGVVIELPDPVPLDSYRQYISQLTQLALLALIIATAGAVSGETRSGTAILVLTKPLSRSAFILAKVAAQMLLVTMVTIVATLICWLETLAIFGDAPLSELASAAALWLLVAWLFICLMVLLSVALRAQVGAAGTGIVIYFLLTILAQWGLAQQNSPAGLFPAMNEVIVGQPLVVALPITSAVFLSAALIAMAIWRFSMQELAGRATS